MDHEVEVLLAQMDDRLRRIARQNVALAEMVETLARHTTKYQEKLAEQQAAMEEKMEILDSFFSAIADKLQQHLEEGHGE